MMNLLLLCLLTTLPADVHEFHVSRCEVVFRSETGAFEITHHMFADDVELALRENFNGPLHLATELEVDEADSIFKDYLLDHLAISFEGSEVPLHYLGKEAGEGDAAMWVYVEAELEALPDELTIAVELLLDTFSDQKNIVSFQVDNGKKQMFLLDRSEPEISFSTQ